MARRGLRPLGEWFRRISQGIGPTVWGHGVFAGRHAQQVLTPPLQGGPLLFTPMAQNQ